MQGGAGSCAAVCVLSSLSTMLQQVVSGLRQVTHSYLDLSCLWLSITCKILYSTEDSTLFDYETLPSWNIFPLWHFPHHILGSPNPGKSWNFKTTFFSSEKSCNGTKNVTEVLEKSWIFTFEAKKNHFRICAYTNLCWPAYVKHVLIGHWFS